jgi:two-component system NtrC family response regulator
MNRLFIVDDEPGICRVLSTLFTREGWDVVAFNNPAEALKAVPGSDVDVLITDLQMPEMTGVQLLEALRKGKHTVPVLVITAHGTIASAVEAMRLGAFDYLTKPFDMEAVKLSVQRALSHGQLQRENAYLREELQARYQFHNLIGMSPQMQEVYRLIEKAARSKASVLILGESGTGKELVARALHFNSPRAKARFVAVSCAALPSELLESELFGHEKGAFTGAMWQKQGRFELADKGTLFLDEIGDIAHTTQLKLLRVLQEREFERVGGTKPISVDVRVIAATNRDLQEAIAKGDFREDLYYRLKVIEITLPSLRERPEDIPVLVQHFVGKYAAENGKKVEDASAETMAVLQAYPWPGNIRELENAIEHSLVMAEDNATLLTTDLLPQNVRQGKSGVQAFRPGTRVAGDGVQADKDGSDFDRADADRLNARTPERPESPSTIELPGPGSHEGSERSMTETIAETEKQMLIQALEDSNWNLTRAAETLGITFRSMRYNVKKYGLSREEDDRHPAGARR